MRFTFPALEKARETFNELNGRHDKMVEQWHKDNPNVRCGNCNGRGTTCEYHTLDHIYGSTYECKTCNCTGKGPEDKAVPQFLVEALALARLNVTRLDRLKGNLRGTPMVVIKGRKVPKGTIGEIVRTGVGQYGPWVEFRDNTGKHHLTGQENVQITVQLDNLEPIIV